VRVIDDGREEIQAGNRRKVIGDSIDRRIVGCLNTNQKVLVFCMGQLMQNLHQGIGPYLGRSTGTACPRGKFYLTSHA
jgi:hypothetical protein